MSSGDTARQGPDVEGLLRAWLQTQGCRERGLHLLRADDFQGVCDGHLVEARLSKGDYREINPPVPPRERRSAAERLVEQLHKCNKIGLGAASAARPQTKESQFSFTAFAHRRSYSAFPSQLARPEPFAIIEFCKHHHPKYHRSLTI